MNPTGQIVATTLVELSRFALYAYAIHAGRAFLLHWLDTRTGMPLFNTPRMMTKNEAIDAARKYGLTDPTAEKAAA